MLRTNASRLGSFLRLNSLGTRIAAAVMAAVLSSAALVAIYEVDREGDYFLERSLTSETHRANLAGLNFRKEINDLRTDLTLLAEAPAVREFVASSAAMPDAPGDGTAASSFWKDQLEEIFETLLEQHPHYRQVRVIGIAEGGLELIRVARSAATGSGARIERSGPGELQRKGDRDYFLAALQLQPNQIHLSNLNLNQEHGKIEIPHWPTLRAVTPVFAPDGFIFGMIVINMDMNAAFSRIAAAASPGSLAYLVKEDGEFLIHPEPAKTFGSDLGHPHRWQTDFPDIPLDDITLDDDRDERVYRSANGDKPIYFAEAVIPFDPSDPERRLHLFYAFTFDLLTAIREHGTVTVLAAILVAACAFCALVALYLRHALAPLSHLADAARDVAAGKLRTPLPESDLIEISPLVQAMSEMRQELQVRESSPVMMHSIDPSGRLLFVNEYWLSRLGYTRDEVLGRHIFDFLSETSRRDSKQRFLPLFLETGRLQNVLMELVTKTGEKLYCLLFTRSLRAQDGSVARSLSVMVDVTKEKRFEAAFRESEEKFQQAFESAGHGIALLDPAGTWIQSNRELRQMLGFEEGDPPRGDFLAHADSSNVRTIRTEVSHLIKGASDSFQLETELVRADDRRIPVMLGFGVVRDPEGNATYLVCHVTDLTELKTAEARFLQAQKMEAVGNLTGGIAHDFNNLLAVILGNLQLLKRRVKDQDDIGGFIEDAIGATRRGADLTRQLLAFSRRQTLEPKPVRVNDMLADMEKLLARTLGTHIEIALRLASDLPVAQVDPSQLESAILNLAINARDAMPDGGHLTISSSEAVISKSDAERLPEVRPGRYVCITISDTGHGMSPEILERVFEPFFTTKPTGKGTGLGLSMVYGFIKQSGGHVNAYSEENEGTRFTMYLPVTEDSPATPAEDIGTQSLPGGSETVLLVDDEPEFLKVAAAILEDLGYTVLTAPDGPSALADLKKEPKVDLLITDMVMPGGMNGHQLADQARELRPDLPVLLASGFPRDSFANGRRYPLIQKPYLEDALARKVRKVLEAPVPVSNGKDPDSA